MYIPYEGPDGMLLETNGKLTISSCLSYSLVESLHPLSGVSKPKTSKTKTSKTKISKAKTSKTKTPKYFLDESFVFVFFPTVRNV